MTQREPEKTKQARTIETREKIVAAGLALFCRDGYFATSSKKIAKHAGVATGSFYNHFADKKALLIEIHRRHVIRVHQEVEQFFKAHPIVQADELDGFSMMKNMVHLVRKTHEFSPELHREINVLALTDPDFARMDQDEKREAHRKIAQLLEPVKSNMRVADLEAATTIVSQAMEAVIHATVMYPPEIPQERLLDALAEMLNRYLFKS